jgi:7,8-dihydropterin-6-yl-methyl-4-(beta-D-ribofuranosyl)aminobenzene 5'-phosphate synthase
LIAHPQVFANRHSKNDPQIGSLLKEENLAGFFDIQLSSGPVFLTQRLIFLGEIQRKNNFEAQKNIGTVRLKNGEEIPDMVMDDSALVYLSEGGLVIITGCSHAGICNIVEHAKKITGETRILDIIGGLHLQRPTI